MEARREGCPVHGAAPNTPAAVVFPQRERVLSPGNAQIIPVQLVRAGLIADPVALGVPEGAGVEAHDAEAGLGQPLQHHTPARAEADDAEVYLLVVWVAAHRGVDLLDRPQHVLARLRSLELAQQRAIPQLAALPQLQQVQRVPPPWCAHACDCGRRLRFNVSLLLPSYGRPGADARARSSCTRRRSRWEVGPRRSAARPP